MKQMRTSAAILVVAVFSIALFAARARTPAATADNAMPAHRAVIVELFTSEGCSSCPPADALLKTLSEQQPVSGAEIIAMEEHVDYWDQLGWKDPFSSSEFTERQNDYAHGVSKGGVYTPQIVVDGNTQVVGSRSSEVREVIQKASTLPKADINLTPAAKSSGKATFDIKVMNLVAVSDAEPTEVWIAITEKGLHSDVKAGENSGEHLYHAPVARIIKRVDSFRGPNDHETHADIKLESSWHAENLTFVAFAVDKKSRRIIGAGSAPIIAPPAGK